MLVEDRCKKTDTPTMTDDKPMISSEIEIAPVRISGFSRLKRHPLFFNC